MTVKRTMPKSKAATGNTAEDVEALPDLVSKQGEFDEVVNDWLYELELQALSSGKQRDVEQNGIVTKAPLSSIFGTIMRVLSDNILDTC